MTTISGNTTDGFGKKRWGGGAEYEGWWQCGKMHGEGTYTFENGTVQKGRWEHGSAVKTQ